MLRRNDIDNLRWMTILLLFPYHIFTIYNNWGERFYIHLAESPFLSLLVKIVQPWFMPLLFVLAGISTIYALQRRTPKQYLQERISKLLIPLISGILLIIPSLTYFAERFHNGYTGGYFAQYQLFFSKTDLVGYSGGFTPAHLWFIAYLFVVSLIALPLILLWKKYLAENEKSNSLILLFCLFLVIWLCSYILDINGKSLGRYFALFLLGAVVLSREGMQEKLAAKRWIFLSLWLVATILLITVTDEGIVHEALFHLTSWLGILTLLGLSRPYLNFHNQITSYFTKASFALYIFHLPWVVAIAYFISPLSLSIPLQLMVLLSASFILTVATYELIRRIPCLRTLFAIKK